MEALDRPLRAVLLDDESDSQYIRGVVRGAESLGVEITAVAEAGALFRTLRDSEADVLIVDMRMGMPAKQIARDSVRQRPGLAIFFWTGYPADPDFSDLDQSLNPLVRCSKGTKLPGADNRSDVLFESLIGPIERLVDEPKYQDGPLEALGTSVSEGTGVYQMTVDEFATKDIETAESLLFKAHEASSALLNLIFAETAAEWVLIAGPKMDVIRWGASIDNMPDTGRIRDLGNRYKYMPILFVRPVEVDDFSATALWEESGWAECGPGDYYPSLGIDFLKGKARTRQVHFDTGTPKTLLSFEDLDSTQALGEFNSLDLRPGVRAPGSPFVWLDQTIQLVLSDGHESHTVKLRVMVVRNWLQSPFIRLCRHGGCPGTVNVGERSVCARREIGLLGRDVLISGRLVVVLDGVRRKTFFQTETKGPRRGFGRLIK